MITEAEVNLKLHELKSNLVDQIKYLKSINLKGIDNTKTFYMFVKQHSKLLVEPTPEIEEVLRHEQQISHGRLPINNIR